MRSWRYAEAGRRDARLDLLRGYAVFAMIVDHVGGNSWLTPFTGANRFIVSAAEGFVLLAGLVIGMVYGRRMVRDGWLPAAEAILNRAAILYGVTVGLTLFFVVVFTYTDLKLWLDRAYGLGLTDPVELVVGTLTLHYTYHGTDILWMYTIMIAASPLMLMLVATGRTLHVLAASWIVWLVYQLFPAQATIPWVATNVNYFPVAAWQVIFVTGLVIGFHRERIARLLGRVHPAAWLVAFSLAMAYLILIQRAHDTGRLASWPILGRLAGDYYYVLFDKPSLAIGRLVAFALVCGFAYSLTTVFWVPLRAALGWLLLPLGTNSLRAYSVHLIMILVVYNVDVLAELYDRSRTNNTIIQAATVALTYLIIVGWRRLEGAEEWLPRIPGLAPIFTQQRVRLGATSLAIAAIAILGGLIVGPVRASRPVDVATAMEEASILRHEPAATAQPPPTLLALHAEGDTGPDFGRRLVDAARNSQWRLIAPTLAYRDWNDPEQVVEGAVETLPWLRELVAPGVEAGAGPPAPILVLGMGRGAHTATMLALYYPDVVSAVATVGPATCIVPSTPSTQTPDTPPLPFPLGIDDLEQYVGDELDEDGLGGTLIWLGISPRLDEAAGGCPWGVLAGAAPESRAETFGLLARRIGATVEIDAAGESATDEELLGRAVERLRRHVGP